MQRFTLIILALWALSACQSTVSPQPSSSSNTSVYGSVGVSGGLNEKHEAVGVTGTMTK